MPNSFTKNIPNSITCCNLICGCIATMFAFDGNYDFALLFIILGAVFDFFDGMTARLLHVSSPIGKELDSLADVVTFGVAPSTMVFTLLYQLPYSGFFFFLYAVVPYTAFLIAAFSALRLAKFNLDERQTTSFIGLPTPANALFWGALIAGGATRISHMPYAVCMVVALVALSCWMLVAEIPLFALKFKQWGWKGNEVKYTFIITAALFIAILGISGIAVVIVWYVVLSLANNRFGSRKALHNDKP